MKITVFIVLIVLVSGCVTQKKCSQRFPPEIILIEDDSSYYQSDTIIKPKKIEVVYNIDPDSINQITEAKFNNYIDSLFSIIDQNVDKEKAKDYIIKSVDTDTSNLENAFSISQAAFSNGQLYHELFTKQGKLVIDYDTWDTLVKTREAYYNFKSETKIIKENYVTGWQWFQIWAGRIVLILIVLLAAYKGFTTKFAGISRILK